MAIARAMAMAMAMAIWTIELSAIV